MDDRLSPGGTRTGLVTFFAVAFGLPWSGWIAIRLIPSLGHAGETAGGFWLPAAASLAGFAAISVDGGLPALKAFARRVFSVKFKPGWWLVALSLPLLAAALTFVTHPADLVHGGHPQWLKLLAPITLVNLWTGPLAEEFGWRGYLLQRFRSRLSPAVAGLAIGLIWALWHVPLFYDSVYAHLSSACSFIAWLTAWSVVMCVVVSRCRGSVLPSVLIHFLINNQFAFFAALLPAMPGERLPGGLAFSVTSIVVAAGFVWLTKRIGGSQIPASQAMEVKS